MRSEAADLPASGGDVAPPAEALALEIAGFSGFAFDFADDAFRFSPAAAALFAVAGPAPTPWRDWLAGVHAEDRGAVAALAQWAGADSPDDDLAAVFRFSGPHGWRWIDLRARILRGPHGQATGLAGVVGAAAPPTLDRRAALSRAEAQHRVKNLLAMVRSLSTASLEKAASLEDYGLHFGGRLAAFARLQGMSGRRFDGGVELEDLLREEFIHHAAGDDQVTLNGPAVFLRGKAAETFGLAVHELAVNAVKFGALSTPRGRIRVAWRLDGHGADQAVEVVWREEGVSVVTSAPARVGFGRALIEEGLPYQTRATTRFDLEPGGLTCVIRLPLSEAAA